MVSPLISPSALVELTRYAVGTVVGTVATVATVPERVMGLLGQAELLASRITVIAENAETLVARLAVLAADADEAVQETKVIVAAAALTVREAEAVAGTAGRVVRAAESVAVEAARVVGGAGAAAAEAQELLDAYSETLQKAAPLAARFVAELSPEEITAAIKMVDALPALRQHLVEDVMPLLGKLDQVGPDLHSLLEVTEDLRLAIAGLPGLKMLRRRGEEKIEEGSANGS
jgi:hypothetical protein